MTRNDRQSHLGGFSEGHFSSLDDDDDDGDDDDDDGCFSEGHLNSLDDDDDGGDDDDGCFSEGHLNSLEDDASKLLRIDSVHSIFTIVDCHNHFHYEMSP